MRWIKILLLLTVLLYGGWFLWNHNSQMQEMVQNYVEGGNILTLEARVTPEKIIASHPKQFQLQDNKTLEEPTIKFAPHLLVNAKYTLGDGKTKEGELLWDMTDGEIVLHTDSWEMTHGFEDCINADANRNDFKLMQTLESHRGRMTREELLVALHLEPEMLEGWITSAKEKHLIVQNGNSYSLHFENPKLLIIPQSKITQPFVSKSSLNGSRLSKKYSKSQIERVAKAAFGPDFTIRETQEVYVPIYQLSIINPDGTIFSTQWNALTGKPLK